METNILTTILPSYSKLSAHERRIKINVHPIKFCDASTHQHTHLPWYHSVETHIYRNIMEYNTNKTAYKRQIELYSVIPNFISRTICRHFRPGQENTFYGHNLKVLHTRLSQKKGVKEKRNWGSCTFTTKWHIEKTLFMTYSLLGSFTKPISVYLPCSFEKILPTSSSLYCLSLQNAAIHWF